MYAYADKKQAATDKNKSTAPKIPSQMRTAAPNKTGIPDTMKTRFENLSGFSFDDVRVHYNSDKPAQLQALAYTQGNQVYVAPGQEKHLGHELGHVVQQKQGRVYPTITQNGLPVNDDAALEAEADSLKFVREETAVANGNIVQQRHNTNNSIIQGRFVDATSASGATAMLMGITTSTATYFTKLRDELNSAVGKSVFIEYTSGSGFCSYRPISEVAGIITLNQTLLSQLDAFCKKTDATKEDKEAFISSISLISHEFSHARDHLILSKPLNLNKMSVIETELKAHAVQAISAIEVGNELKEQDPAHAALIRAWVQVDVNMLDDIYKNRKENKIIDIVYRYATRGEKFFDDTEAKSFLSTNIEVPKTKEQITKLKGVIMGKLS